MKQIDVGTLRDWLDNGRPVTVLDIRTVEDRAQWSIPGSMHVNAYAALKAGNPNALQQVEIPMDRPAVTICNAGVVSQVAAEQLSRRGIDAAALTGGMKSWSLVWNTAELSFGDITIIQVRRTGKGCLSYLVASASQAWLSMHRWTQWSTCISPSSAVGKSVTPVLLGLGTAMVYPTLIAAVADVAQPTWRASAVGVYRLWRDGGYAIGALLAGVLADLLGIPWAVGVVGGLTFLSGLIVAVVMYEPMNQRSAERASCIT